ncbi:C40 family peptidase [Dactylosporangium sp. NPDC048998]|uniref:C40 family peptidase n=1 Tax=Dactylosporangium sp. NPDC048998 TaxID=3363976 RepID=UPI00371C20D8
MLKRLARTGAVLALLVVVTGTFAIAAKPGPASAAPTCNAKVSGAASQAMTAVTKACQQIGVPYSWGGGHGATPGLSYGACRADVGAPNDCHVYGLDCSGLTRYAYYLAVGSDVLGRTTAQDQYYSSRAVRRWGKSDGTAPLLPGDLVFFGTSQNIHHVAMYLGQGYIVEAPHSGALVSVASLSSHGDYYGAIRLYNPGGGTPPPPPPPTPNPNTQLVDTFANAPTYETPSSTTQTGTLYAGTNYVYCKVWGRQIGSGSSYNHWWLKTDPDEGAPNQFVSAYYLSRWGNDEAKDNSGVVIRDCAQTPPPPPTATKYWVDTFANAAVYASATSTTQTGTLNGGTNYVYCKVWGRQIGSGSSYNHWWLKTDPDVGPADQYVSAYYLSRWGNDEAKDNSGVVIPDCASSPPPPPAKYWVDTWDTVSVYASATSTSVTGTLYAGTNYVFCKVWGRQIGSGSSYNHWWLKTDPDVGPANQYVSAYYLSRWGNDEAKDNNGVVIPDC